MSTKTNIVGIDLGTTFSALAILDDLGVPHIISVDGSPITRSVVYVPPGEKTALIGEEAWNSKQHEPSFVIEEVKRKMGTEESVVVGDRTFSPTEISAMILKKLIQGAEELHGKIEKAVITVPANFLEKARADTMEAGRLAGIEVEHIVNEPTAAALHYAMHHDVSGRVAIFDLGGGTLDVTLAEIEGTKVEVMTSNGVAELGGRDFDRLILGWVDRVEKEKNGAAFFETEDERESAIVHAEQIKKTLSKLGKTTVSLHVGRKTFSEEITREVFEELLGDLIGQCKLCVESALDQVGWEPEEVDDLLLVGGSTRIPIIKEMLTGIFGKEPLQSVNPDEAVALGAATYAGVRAAENHPEELTGRQRTVLDKVALKEVANAYYGTTAYDEKTKRNYNSIIINRDTPLPCSVMKTFMTLTKGQSVNCNVTQSPVEELDTEMVEEMFAHLMKLPDDTPAGSELQITFSYDQNMRMKAEFYHPDSGNRFDKTVDVGPAGAGTSKAGDNDMFDDFEIE